MTRHGRARRATRSDPLAALVRSRAARLLLLAGAGLGLAGLVVLHLRLLWARIADLSIGEPTVALRWLAGGLLLLGLAALARRGRSLVGDRQALTLWVLVLLVHLAAVPPPSGPCVPAPGSGLWLGLPLSLAATALLEAAALCLLAGSRPPAPIARLAGRTREPGRWRAGGVRGLPRFLQRPPPPLAA